MNKEDWYAKSAELIEYDRQKRRLFHATIDAKFEEIFGEEPKRCSVCQRIMVPRKFWVELSIQDRYSVAFVGAGNSEKCHYDRMSERSKERSNPLSEAEVNRLRELEGVKLNGSQ